MHASYQVEGLRELQRAAARARDREVPRAVRQVNLRLANRVVQLALPNVPVLSGKLRASVKALASAREATMKAGSPARVPYAPPIHWGWPRRGITGRRFLWNAMLEARRNHQFEQAYLDEVMDALQALNARRA